MAYMTVSVRHPMLPSREDNIMHEEEQVVGKHIDNVTQFTAELHEGH